VCWKGLAPHPVTGLGIHKQTTLQGAPLVRSGRLDEAVDLTAAATFSLSVRGFSSLVNLEASDLQVAAPFLVKLTYDLDQLRDHVIFEGLVSTSK
jgi:hypothetical protein